MEATKSPKISLCMIVRNEAELLPRCLEHAAGVWNELCVVDTGSSDGTQAIVEAAGGRVIHHPWGDDFSAARNVGLAHATGEWVLVLDADEMLSPELVTQILKTAENEAVGAATLVMKNQLPHGHRRESRLLRFFRRNETIRFEHRIHEDASESILRCLRRSGKHMAHLSGVVEHLGYTVRRASSRNKKARDLALLEASVKERPQDLYSWFKILELARFWVDLPLWYETAVSALQQMRKTDTLSLRRAHFGGEMVALISQGLHAGDSRRALGFVEHWAGRVSRSAPLLLRRGELRETRGDLGGARADFISCLAFKDALGDLQMATVRPLLGLARLAIASGDLREAWNRVREALAFSPRDPEALLAAVALSRNRGGLEAVQKFVMSHAAEHGDSPELHGAMGDEALLSGQTQLAVDELRIAAGDPPAGKNGIRLAQAFLANGELHAARSLAKRLCGETPEAVLGILVCDLIEGVDSDLQVNLEPVAADAALRSWVDVLRVHRCQSLMGRFRGVIPAVRELFPWLSGYVNQVTPSQAQV